MKTLLRTKIDKELLLSKDLDENDIIRVPDKLAKTLIDNGNWIYVSKSVWKEQIRNPALESTKNKSKKNKKKKKGE